MKLMLSSGLFLVVCSGAAYGEIIFTLGNHPQPGETNVLLNSGGIGTLVTGELSGTPGVVVDFMSSDNLLEPAAGQARVSANPVGSPLTNLTISLEGNFTYDSLIINPFIGGSCPQCTGGASSIIVNALANDGTPEDPFIFTGLNVGNGSNFLTIVASDGESIVSTSIDVPGGIADLRQPRISGATDPPAAAPEPGSLTLLGLGLGGVFLVCKARKPGPMLR